MSKFQVGEIAIFAEPYTPEYRGDRVEILDLGSFPAFMEHPLVDGVGNSNSDCVIKTSDGEIWFSDTRRLRKLPPDSDSKTLPDCVTKLFDGRKVSNPDRKPVAA